MNDVVKIRLLVKSLYLKTDLLVLEIIKYFQRVHL